MIANNARKGIIFIQVTVGFFLGIFILVLLLTNYVISQENNLADKIYPNVYIDAMHAGYKSRTEMREILERRYAPLKGYTLTVIYKDSPVATFNAEMLGLHSDAHDVVEKAYLVGRTTRISSRILQKVNTIFKLDTYDFHTSITYDKNNLKTFTESMEDRYNIPAKNALFTFENNRVTDFRKEEKGLKISTAKFYEEVEKKLKNVGKKTPNEQIRLTDSLVEPEVTLSEANEFNIEELIGEGKSDYSHSIPERIHNVKLAASKFNGVLIPKDSTFSFNETIGDISAFTGYKPAYVIKAGKTVLGDGGGVCQVSTTFFRAALNTGLPIVERNAHAYRVGYYENDSKPGLDATIYTPTVDLRIKNDTPTAILIQTEIDDEHNILYFRFYGKKDSRKVEISPVVITNEQPPLPPLYQDDPTLKKGIVKQVEYAAWGAKASFTYKVTRESDILQDETFISQYRPWQAVFLVGQSDN